MAVFNTSFLLKDRSGGGGEGSGALVDQLQILENSLAKDGILAPGDYDLLIEQTKQMMNSGGLTASQRGNFRVKLSAYEKEKSVSSLSKADDIDTMNRTIESEASEDVIAAGNDPELYLQGRTASLEAKLNDLAEIIDRRDAVGQDTTEYKLELNETFRKYNDVIAATGASQGFTGNVPVSGFVAYISTNDDGEIVDVEYGRYGSKQGYVETNGMVKGFQVYGKVNAKEGDKNVFKLGNERFSGTDMVTPDPANPGVFKVSRLVAESQQSGGGVVTRGTSGFRNFEPQELMTQSYIPRNSWAKSSDGTLYKRREDGGYSKYLNYTPTEIDPKSIFKIPKSLEASIRPYVSETIDGSLSISSSPDNFIGPQNNFVGPQQLQSQSKSGGAPQAPELPQSGPTLEPTSAAPSVNQRTPAPVSRSPQTSTGYAGQTIAKAGKFFKDLFTG